MHSERQPPGTPPCESCRVELKVENEDAAKVYMLVRGQTRTRHNGRHDVVVDIDHAAIWAAIDGYGIKDRTGTFEAVIQAWHAIERERQRDES